MSDTTEHAAAVDVEPAEIEGAAAFVDAETREILSLLGESDAGGSCCGGSCCSV